MTAEHVDRGNFPFFPCDKMPTVYGGKKAMWDQLRTRPRVGRKSFLPGFLGEAKDPVLLDFFMIEGKKRTVF